MLIISVKHKGQLRFQDEGNWTTQDKYLKIDCIALTKCIGAAAQCVSLMDEYYTKPECKATPAILSSVRPFHNKVLLTGSSRDSYKTVSSN